MKNTFTEILIYALFGILILASRASPLLATTPGATDTKPNIIVSGTVTDDEEGEGLPGVNVLEKGTSSGTVTDIDGNYSIEVAENATLVFSSVGYATQEIEVNSRSVIDLVLNQEVGQLEELVVVGYGKKEKENLIGAVSTVSSDELANQTITSAAQALAGRVSGVQLIQGSGQPGQDNPVLNVRGVSTIRNSVGSQNADTGPLIIVDGVQATMADIHPQDIESMSILKDASSAAIYGARAANGVILITTKKGRSNAPTVSINTYYGWQSPTFIPEVLNPYEYALLRNESRTNVGRPADYDADMLNWFRNFQDESYADYAYVKNAPLVNSHIAVRGGSENVKYMVSVGYQNQQGVMINTDSKRYNIRSNVDATISEKVRTGINFAASLTDNREPSYEGYGVTMLVRNSLRHSPFALVDGLIKEDGYYSIGTAERAVGNAAIAPAEVGGMNDEKIYRATPKAYFEYEPIKDLILNASASVFLENSRGKQFNSPYIVSDGETLYPRNGIGQLTESNNLNTTTLIELTANYTKQVGESVFSGLLGFSDQSFVNDYFQGRNSGYPSDAVQKLNAGSIDPNVSGSGQEWGLRSVFGRLGYTYANKYLAEFNVRYDGSSRFGPNNRWGVFPSFSLGWVMSEEGFMQSVAWLDNLKLRANWGQLGNQNIGNYRHIATISLDQAYIFNNSVVPGAAATSLANPNIQWETTTMSDFGINATVFNNRLSIEADYYEKITDDILLTPPVPKTLGNLDPPAQNQGKVENKGYELMVSYFGSIGSEFTYSVSANWSHNDNKVLELENEFISSNKIITRVGDPISSYYGHRILGIFNSDSEAQNTERWGVQPGGPTHAGGDYIYADENGDGVVDAADRVIIGNTNIMNTLGGTLTMEYRGLDFRILFQGVMGRDIEDGVFANDGLRGGNNLFKRWLNRWTPDNQDTDVPRVAAGVNYNTSLFVGPPLSARINDASYLRAKHIELGYTLPEHLINRAGLSRVRLYVAAQNLFTITNFVEGFDPEDALQFNDVNDSYPQAKTVSVGANLVF